MASSFPLLNTARLVLRPLTLADAPAIFAYAQDPEVSRYTLWEPHRTQADSETFIRDYALPRYAEGLPEPYGVTLRGDERVVGTVGCFAVTQDLAWTVLDTHKTAGLLVLFAVTLRAG